MHLVSKFVLPAAATALAAVPVCGVAAPAAADAPTVYAVQAGGAVVASHARLEAGTRVRVYASGYASGARVEVVDVARRSIRYVQAGPTGTAAADLTVPQPAADAADFVLALAGPVAGSSSTGPAGNVTVTVPLLRRFVYRVDENGDGNGTENGNQRGSQHGAGGSNVDAIAVGPGTGIRLAAVSAHGAAALSVQALAHTGFDAGTIALIGLLLVGGGLVVLRAASARGLIVEVSRRRG